MAVDGWRPLITWPRIHFATDLYDTVYSRVLFSNQRVEHFVFTRRKRSWSVIIQPGRFPIGLFQPSPAGKSGSVRLAWRRVAISFRSRGTCVEDVPPAHGMRHGDAAIAVEGVGGEAGAGLVWAAPGGGR